MSLHNGVDTCAIVSNGVYSKTYGATNPSAIANLASTFGLIEDAVKLAVSRQFWASVINCVLSNSRFGSKV